MTQGTPQSLSIAALTSPVKAPLSVAEQFWAATCTAGHLASASTDCTMPAVVAAERAQDPDDARAGVRLIYVEPLAHFCDVANLRSVRCFECFRCFECIDVHGGACEQRKQQAISASNV